MNKTVYILLPDIRSAYNVGSIFRTADCFGVSCVYLTGATPQPIDRFGRSVSGPQKEIAKTALGGEKSVMWKYAEKPKSIIQQAKKDGFCVIGIEQDVRSVDIHTFSKKIQKEKIDKLLCVFGNEVEGISKDVLKLCDYVVDIRMQGKKESLNVAVCTGVVCYEFLK